MSHASRHSEWSERWRSSQSADSSTRPTRSRRRRRTITRSSRAAAGRALTFGEAIAPRLAGANIPATGALAALHAAGHRTPGLAWGAASPSAHVTKDAFERIVGEITARLAQAGPVDGVYLDLHGAMVTEHLDDGEGEILARVRKHRRRRACRSSRASTCTPTSRAHDGARRRARRLPHLSARRHGRDRRARRGAARAHAAPPARPLAHAMRPLDFLTGLSSQSTFIEPGRRLYELLEQLEREHDTVLSFTPGFPMADFPECQMAVFGYGPDAGARAARGRCARQRGPRRRARVRAGAPDAPTRRWRAPRSAATPARRSCSPTRRTIPAPAATATPRGCSPRCSSAIRATRCWACSSTARRPSRRTRSASAARAEFKLGETSGVPGHVPLAGEFEVDGARRRQVHVHRPDVQGLQDGARPDGGAAARATCASCSRPRRCRPPTRRCSVTSASSPSSSASSRSRARCISAPTSSRSRREVLVVVAPGPAKADPTMFQWTRLRPGLRLKPGGPGRSARAPSAPSRHAPHASSSASSSTRPTPSRRSRRRWPRSGTAKGPAYGDAARARFENTNTPMAAYLDVARRENAEVVTPVAAEVVALEQGVARDVRDAGAAARGRGARRLRRRLPRPARRDGDRGLRRRRRRDRAAPAPHRAASSDRGDARLPHEPVGTLVDNATVITGYKTYPHVDMYEAGMLAGGILVGALDGAIEPVMAWGWKPLLASIMRHAPEDGPSGDILAVRAAHGGRRHGARRDAAVLRFRTRTRRTPGVSAIVVGDARHGGREHAQRGVHAHAGDGVGAPRRVRVPSRRRSPNRSRARRRWGSPTPARPCCSSTIATTAARAARRT